MPYIGIKPSDVAGAGQANITGSLTAGSATVTDDLTVDTNTLYVDSTNNRVGVGNAAPTTALDVTGDIMLSGGVYLGGTGSANYLDDYEEGTWSPQFTDHSNIDRFSSYSQQDGAYTKVGNICKIAFDVIGNVVSSTSGSYLCIGNLPFTPASGGNNNGVLNIGYMDNIGYSTMQGGLFTSNGPVVYLVTSGTSFASPASLISGSRVICSAVYRTA